MQAKVLIVDDEPDMLHLLKRSLEPDLDCRIAQGGGSYRGSPGHNRRCNV